MVEVSQQSETVRTAIRHSGESSLESDRCPCHLCEPETGQQLGVIPASCSHAMDRRKGVKLTTLDRAGVRASDCARRNRCSHDLVQMAAKDCVLQIDEYTPPGLGEPGGE